MSDTLVVPQGTDPSAADLAAKAAAETAAKEAAAKAAAEAAAARASGDPDLVRMTPAQLKTRLDEARTAEAKRAAEQFAADLGIPLADAKKIIADAKAKDDAQKSEVQKLTEQLAAEKARLVQFDAYKQTVEGRAGIEFAALSDAQKAAVETLAGADPAARLRTIDALRPTWAAAEAKAVADAQAKAVADAAATKAAEEAAKKTAPLPAPASTTPAAPPPPPAAPGQPTNHLAVYQSLQQTNPAMAAKYHATHAPAIVAAQRQQRATG